MAVAELIRRLRAKGQDAVDNFDSLAVRVVDGGTATDKQIEAACVGAGKSLADFAERLALLERRKSAWDAYKDRDWEAERQAAKAECVRTSEQIKEVIAEVETLQKERGRLHELNRAELSKMNRVDSDRQAARRAFSETLAVTGGGQDWKSFDDTVDDE